MKFEYGILYQRDIFYLEHRVRVLFTVLTFLRNLGYVPMVDATMHFFGDRNFLQIPTTQPLKSDVSFPFCPIAENFH